YTGIYTAVSMSDGFGCAIDTNKNILCWGRDNAGQTRAPVGAYTDLTTGSDYACGRSEGAGWRCWGNTGRFSEAPTGWEDFPTLAAGWEHLCGLDAAGIPHCWGDMEGWRQPVPEGLSFVKLSAGNPTTCGLDVDGQLTCWAYALFEYPSAGGRVDLDVGWKYYCVIYDDGDAGCQGQVEESGRRTPSGVFKSLSCGRATTCGIDEEDKLKCWDYEMDPPEPLRMPMQQVSVGVSEACALDQEGELHCWGFNNDDGQLNPP
ncbi:MAG TPA: RCC1 domain-containing protein, partial [Myxococcota bacterium]|nr:RCC1 domain-containing protein [Myxococcota bacterium]